MPRAYLVHNIEDEIPNIIDEFDNGQEIQVSKVLIE